jgi:hypothetical protein
MKKIFKYSFYVLLLVLSLYSLFSGINKSQKLSHDFLYSPSVMTWNGENHYDYILNEDQNNKNDGKFIFYQRSGYGHALYIIFYPFTKLSWDNSKIIWMLINVFLAFYIPIILSKKQSLNNTEIYICLSLFLIGTPLRHVLNMGQQSLFVFLFLILPFLSKKKIFTVLSGISFVKYSIGYGLFLFFLSQKNLNKILLSSIVSVIGWLSYSFLTNSNIFINLIEPLKVTLYLENTSNLVYGFSFLKHFFSNFIWIDYLVISLSILMSFLFIYKINNLKNNFSKLSLLCIIILIFAPHRYHDYILLLPLLIFSIKNFDQIFCKINLLIISYFYYFLIIVQKYFRVDSDFFQINEEFLILNYFNLILLLVLLFMNFKFLSKKTYDILNVN